MRVRTSGILLCMTLCACVLTDDTKRSAPPRPLANIICDIRMQLLEEYDALAIIGKNIVSQEKIIVRIENEERVLEQFAAHGIPLSKEQYAKMRQRDRAHDHAEKELTRQRFVFLGIQRDIDVARKILRSHPLKKIDCIGEHV